MRKIVEALGYGERRRIRGEILECAETRRFNHRQVNGFLAHPDEIAWLQDVSNSEAVKRLEDLNIERQLIREALPPLEIDGKPSDVSVCERFVSFLTHPQLGNLDLARRQHVDGDWTQADEMQRQLDELMKVKSADLNIFAFAPSEITTIMHVHATDENALNMGLVVLTRNRRVGAIAHDGDMSHIMKRSEFIFDANLAGSFGAQIVRQIKESHGGNATLLVGEAFDEADTMIQDRDEPVDPIYTTIFAYREPQQVAKVKPANLSQSPELSTAWDEFNLGRA